MVRMTSACILAIYLFTVTGVGQSAGRAKADGAHANSESVAVQLQRFTAEQTEAGKFSGVVLVAKSGKPIVSASYGVANRKTQTPIRMDTKFNLGSMPKMFTAVAIAQLAERGKLRFNDPIIKYLPDYPDKKVAEQVTIHQLLTHTAGFGNYFRPGFLERRLNTVKEYLALVAEDPLIGEPGAQYQYSNSGYVVLGAIVERVSGEDFYDYVRDHIFRPAGMTDTAFYTREEHVDNVATGYTRGQGLMVLQPGQAPPSGSAAPPAGMVVRQPDDSSRRQTTDSQVALKDTNEMLPYRGSPAGGAYSTAIDLLKFVEALENHKLVNEHSLEMLQRGKVDTQQSGARYGYGFNEWRVAGQRIVGHGGGAPGVNTMLQIYPDLGYSVIVLSNFDPPAAEQIAAKARDLLLAGATTASAQTR